MASLSLLQLVLVLVFVSCLLSGVSGVTIVLHLKVLRRRVELIKWTSSSIAELTVNSMANELSSSEREEILLIRQPPRHYMSSACSIN